MSLIMSEIKDGKLPAHRVPMRRPGLAEDMQGLILYLASRAGAYVNGNVAVVDGGRLSLACSTY
jgi:NAD(P)-dependent dehydrogenase (short-subunit alcohol dehydrogenase family)